MHCLGCGYDLRDLNQPACPECGRAFDPANPQTWAHPRADRYRKLARLAGRACLLIAVCPALISAGYMAIGHEGVFPLVLAWVYALAPLAVALTAWVGCLAGCGRFPGGRAVIIGLLLLVLNASLFTQWPTMLSFGLYRTALNTNAQQAQQLYTYNPPKRIGLFTIHGVYTVPNPNRPNAVFFQVEDSTSNASYLVYGMSDREIQAHFNVWSARRLDKDWVIVHED